MATITIDFGALNDAVSKSKAVASDMESYADGLSGKVVAPLGSLTGGSSAEVSGAISLAQAKASQLRERAERYVSVANQVKSFGKSARDADEAVGNKLSGFVESRKKGLSLWGHISCGIYQVLGGGGVVGHVVRSLLNRADTAFQGRVNAIKKIWDWFKHGEGRYVIDFVFSFVGAVGALAAVVYATPAATFVGGLMLALSVFVAVDKVVDFFVTTVATCTALKENSTEPGRARYYGSATSLSEFSKRYTKNSTFQKAAQMWGASADIAEFFVGIGNLFSYSGFMTVNGKKVPTTGYAFNKDTFMVNLNKQFGREAIVYKTGPNAGAPRLFNGKIKYTFNPKLFGLSSNMKGLDKVKSVKCLTSLVRDSTRIDENFARGDLLGGLGDLASLAFSDFATGIKAPGTIKSGVSAFKGFQTLTSN